MSDDPDGARRALKAYLEAMLQSTLGAYPLPNSGFTRSLPRFIRAHSAVATTSGLIYVALFALLPYHMPPILGPHVPERLFWLGLYAGVYLTWAVLIARLTSENVLAIMRDRVIPALSPATCHAVLGELAHPMNRRNQYAICWTIGVAGAIAAGLLMHRDFNVPVSLALALWSAGWVVIFTTAAKATLTARFYFYVAQHLARDPRELYEDLPVRSASVRAFAGVSRAILLFWTGIAASIAILPFVDGIETPPCDFAQACTLFLSSRGAPSRFISLVVPITGAASLLFGTYIFLRSEGAVRGNLDTVVHATLRNLEAEARDLRAKGPRATAADKARLADLAARHAGLVAATSYGSVVKTALSLSLPLLAPVLAAVITLLPQVFPRLFPKVAEVAASAMADAVKTSSKTLTDAVSEPGH